VDTVVPQPGSVMEVYLTVPAAGDSAFSFFNLVLNADPLLQLVLFGLMCMSFVCWGIIIQKFFRLRSAARQSARFLDLFWASKRLDAVYEKAGNYKKSPVAEVFKAGYQELQKITQGGKSDDATDNLERTLRRAAAVESTTMERYITFLATTGSTAPFIGLFGTVWGIMKAFAKL
jgi:biopolymer transport protein TolQ